MFSSTPNYMRFSLLSLFQFAFFIPIGAMAATHDVMVLDPRSFSPAELTIEVGDTVRWINASGGNLHDVTADDDSFASPTATSFTFERTFNSIAEILYHCSVHSRAASAGGTAQNGSVTVVAPSATSEISVESVNVADGAYGVGQDVSIATSLSNTSSEDSGMFTVSYYASTDTTITSGDALLGSTEISNIAAGATMNIDESVTLPADLAAGDYFVGAISELADGDPGNNTNVDESSIYVFTEFTLNAGLNDAWFDPATDGQGFFITIFPGLSVATMAWFTYDTELPPVDATANLGDPGHRWITGAGTIVGNQAVLNVVLTSEGIFDTATDVQRTDPAGSDGTLTLTFNNCNEGTVDYDITSIDAQGTVPVVRVANDNVALCNALLRESQQVAK